MAVLAVKDEAQQIELNVNTIEEAKNAMISQAKMFGATLDFSNAKTVGTDASRMFIMPDQSIYRFTIIAAKKTTTRTRSSTGKKKSDEPEYPANELYVEIKPVVTEYGQQWAFMSRLKNDQPNGDKAGKSVKPVKEIRVAVYGNCKYYSAPYTDKNGNTLSEPRRIVSDAKKDAAIAKLAEFGIEVV